VDDGGGGNHGYHYIFHFVDEYASGLLCSKKYKIEFLPVELQGFKKKKITMGNDIETSEPLWFALFFHCLK